MKKKTSTLIMGLLLLGGSLGVQAQQLAFPGAQGWGRHATGGRAGTVYHVTNLNDSGTGSFRDAVSQPNRIIVFDVAGVININSRIVFSKNLYVAGQTAPGEGITVYGDGVSFSGADDIIVRYIRFRMGKNGTSGKDAAGIANGKNMIFDHCSFSWGLDEVFSINWDGKGTDPQLITISNSIIGQGLLTHSAGGLMQADSITLYRNFYCDNSTRNNKVKGTNQYVNNIVYNWKNGCYLMGGDSEGTSYVHVTNNLFINGPQTGSSANAITSGNSDFHIYAVDNLQDKNLNGALDPVEIDRSNYTGGPTFEETPYDYPELETWQASELVDKLLPEVGASLPYRDLADFYMVHEVKSFGKEGVLISSESQLPIGVPSSWTTWTFSRTDSDGDGMPDDWEVLNGTDKTKNDAMTVAANGYTNIENYINSICAENRPIYLRTPVLLKEKESTDTSITLSWFDFTEGEEAFELEQQIDGNYTLVKNIDPETESVTVDGLTPGSIYNFRLRAKKGDSYSGYAEITSKTQPEYVEMIDCDTFVGDDDKNWLIAPVADEVITLTEAVDKDAVVVRSDANVTITGAGSITGKASMNKAGAGSLTLDTENSYTGATVLHNGTINFATLKNGGVNSSLGASIEYAQNWIWDGGVWNYTGATTSTNRSAQLYKNTEFSIANSAATVTFGGSINGTSDFILSGAGTLKPTASTFFNYTGATVLKGGTMQLDYVDTDADKVINLGETENVSSKLVMAGGNFATKGINDNYLIYSFPIEVQEGTYSTMTFQRNCSIKCNVSGMGTLEYKVPYVREYITGDWREFYGTLVANGIGSGSDGSQLMFYNSSYQGMPNTRIYLKGNARMVSWNTNDELWIGGISGDAGTHISASSKNTTKAQMIWHVGGANSDETFNGVIDNKTSANKEATTNIVKEGSGIWRLTGTNVYKGTTTVNGGQLIVNGKNNGTGAYTVNANATLAGKGTISGAVTVKKDAVISAGDTLVDGSTLTLASTLGLAAGATVSTPVSKTKCNSLTLKGNMTIADGVTLQLAEGVLAEAPYNATVYQVFNLSGGTISGTFSAIEPATPGEGQTWDTSELYTKGVIKVVGGEDNPDGGEDEPDPTPDTETKKALLTWGNMTAGTYPGTETSGNMLTGVEGDNAEGFTMVVTSNLTKYYSAADKINVEFDGKQISRTTIKCSNGAENSVFLPTGARATKITLWSYTNYTGDAARPCYWASVGGVDYTAENSVMLATSKNTASPNKVSFDLPNIKDVVTFKNSGEQQCVIVYIEYNYGTDEPDGITAVAGNVPVAIDYYTLSGERVATPGKGIYIMQTKTADGKLLTRKVVL